MILPERMEKVRVLYTKRMDLQTKLVEPARAAMRQMQDAGMKNGAAPLEELFFELDVNKSEINAIIMDDPEGLLTEVVAAMKARRGDNPVTE